MWITLAIMGIGGLLFLGMQLAEEKHSVPEWQRSDYGGGGGGYRYNRRRRRRRNRRSRNYREYNPSEFAPREWLDVYRDLERLETPTAGSLRRFRGLRERLLTVEDALRSDSEAERARGRRELHQIRTDVDEWDPYDWRQRRRTSNRSNQRRNRRRRRRRSR